MIIYGITQIKKDFLSMLISKMLCSATFIVITILSFEYSNRANPFWFHLILIAMIFSFIGDLFLAIQKNKRFVNKIPFIIGGISFLFAHIVFTITFLIHNGFDMFILVTSAAIVLTAFAILIKNGMKIYYFTILATIYGFALTFMFSNGLRMHNYANIGAIISIGALLFFISDIIIYTNIGLGYFKKDSLNPKVKTTLNLLNTLTYFSAQLLFALSVLFA
jgi:uncharacterized membrane protein YhhN